MSVPGRPYSRCGMTSHLSSLSYFSPKHSSPPILLPRFTALLLLGGGVVLFYFFGFGFFVWLGFFGLCMLEITLQEGMDFHLFCFVFSFLCIQLGLSK